MMIILLTNIQEHKSFIEQLFSAPIVAAFIGLLGIWLNRLYEAKKARKELLREKAAQAQTIVQSLSTSLVLCSNCVRCEELIKGNKVVTEAPNPTGEYKNINEFRLITRQYFREAIEKADNLTRVYLDIYFWLRHIEDDEYKKYELGQFLKEFHDKEDKLYNSATEYISLLDKYFK